MIKLKKICFKIDNKFILKNLDLVIPKNKTTIIMGKNGSGKSTLLKILNQIIKPSSGKFYSELENPVPMLFQKPILMHNTVDYNYHILNKIKKHQINNTWFKTFNLNNLINQNAMSLSGGEKQKLFLARVMSFNQNSLFLDEPNQSLDLDSENLLLDLLKQEQTNKTIVMTLHDFEIAKIIGDYIVYMENGQILLKDFTDDFFKKFHQNSF